MDFLRDASFSFVETKSKIDNIHHDNNTTGDTIASSLIIVWETAVIPLTEVQRITFLVITSIIVFVAYIGNGLVLYVNFCRWVNWKNIFEMYLQLLFTSKTITARNTFCLCITHSIESTRIFLYFQKTKVALSYMSHLTGSERFDLHSSNFHYLPTENVSLAIGSLGGFEY
jgi:hypothetical protein